MYLVVTMLSILWRRIIADFSSSTSKIVKIDDTRSRIAWLNKESVNSKFGRARSSGSLVSSVEFYSDALSGLVALCFPCLANSLSVILIGFSSNFFPLYIRAGLSHIFTIRKTRRTRKISISCRVAWPAKTIVIYRFRY